MDHDSGLVVEKRIEMKDQARQTELNRAKWDRWADSFDTKSWRRDFLRNAQSQVISLLDVKPGIHFLDVGCGTGWAVGEVAKQAEDKGVFYGVDLSPRMIEKAKENFNGRENVRFLQANVKSIPLDSASFDIIICTNSFHHYPRPDRALAEMQRLLKRGGKLFILDPTADGWIRKVGDRLVRRIEPEHVKMYSTLEFREMFRAAGLRYMDSEEIRAKSKSIHVGEKRI